MTAAASRASPAQPWIPPGSVRVEGLSKLYALSRQDRHGPEADDATDDLAVSGVGDDELEGLEDSGDQPARSPAGAKEIWALRDVSFTVDPGTTLGILGANGAGKTTLLRILGRTITPTAGRATLGGRVAPVSRTAARFLDSSRSGRHNVLLLADLFAIPEETVQRCMSEIFEFAELEDMIDVAVRRYSAGQQQRLAMSMIFNVEPDVLLADELPTAGDAFFKERCSARLMASRERGQTLLLASHDWDLVRARCQRAIRLESGSVVDDGPAADVVDRFLGSLQEPPGASKLEQRAMRAERRAEKLERRAVRAEARAARAETQMATIQEAVPAPVPLHELSREGTSRPDLFVREVCFVPAPGAEDTTLNGDEPCQLSAILDVLSAPAPIHCEFIAVRGATADPARTFRSEPQRLKQPGRYHASAFLPARTLPAGSFVARLTAALGNLGGADPPAVNSTVFRFEVMSELDELEPAIPGADSALVWQFEMIGPHAPEAATRPVDPQGRM